MKLISALRQDSRKWWWFVELRKRGRIQEARELEHASVRNLIYDIRATKYNFGYVTLYNYGTAWKVSDTTMITGCHSGSLLAAKMCGVRFIDERKFNLYKTELV